MKPGFMVMYILRSVFSIPGGSIWTTCFQATGEKVFFYAWGWISRLSAKPSDGELDEKYLWFRNCQKGALSSRCFLCIKSSQ